MNKEKAAIHICGAGPAGLTAAIVAAKAGRQVIVHERKNKVGSRFHNDLQGLENWTGKTDVLAELSRFGIEINFIASPFHEAVLFDPQGRRHDYRSPEPMAYIVHRGPGPDTLDSGLKEQALAAGVEIRFQDACRQLQEGIIAEGPHGADAIGVGYLFETDRSDGAYIALSDQLAPKGYAYVLIQAGRGTLMSWIYSDFHNEQTYLQRCVDFFQDKLGLEMENPQRTGGAANFLLPHSARVDQRLYVGEAAGFQDALWGFGMRYAMVSGQLAAQAVRNDSPEVYDKLWQPRLAGLLKAGLMGRYLYGKLGDRGYQTLLQRIDHSMQQRPDGRQWLHDYTAPSWWKNLCYPLIRRKLQSQRPAPGDVVEGCDCTWCRCQH